MKKRVLRHVWAHPRSRGENVTDAVRAFTGDGSSPLTRGKRRVPSFQIFLVGLIPAHAGKTAKSSSQILFAWAHPRSRGENNGNRNTEFDKCGSSPLTRGKRRVPGFQVFLVGLIPAHAGKTI